MRREQGNGEVVPRHGALSSSMYSAYTTRMRVKPGLRQARHIPCPAFVCSAPKVDTSGFMEFGSFRRQDINRFRLPGV